MQAWWVTAHPGLLYRFSLFFEVVDVCSLCGSQTMRKVCVALYGLWVIVWVVVLVNISGDLLVVFCVVFWVHRLSGPLGDLFGSRFGSFFGDL